MPPPSARDFASIGHIWFLAPFRHLPLPTWVICFLISFTITALNVAIESVYIATDPAHWARVGTVSLVSEVIAPSLLVAYVPTMVCYMWLAYERTFNALRPLWRNSRVEINELLTEQVSFTTWGFWLAGLAGVLIAAGFESYLRRTPLVPFVLEGWDHHKVFAVSLNLAYWTIGAQAVYLWLQPSGGFGASTIGSPGISTCSTCAR